MDASQLSFAYVILFAVLGAFSCFMHIPSSTEFSGYRKSRMIFGGAFFMMAGYCVLRALVPQDHLDEYLDFWILTVVSLLFSWLNYTSFLYIIDSTYTIRKNFIIDGVIPLSAMILAGVLGIFFKESHTALEISLGAIFIIKNFRMFYVCEREWRKVNKEQQNYYDEEVDIRWMRVLVWITLLLSICTLIALYSAVIHILYCFVAPLIFVFMTFKVVNYVPRKIDNMRQGKMSKEGEKESAPKVANLEDKLKPMVDRWVAEKRYCVANLSIKEVAIQMGTNHNYLSQYLNSTLNMTFQLWLNTLRIEESKRILASENISIEEVGIKVGIPESYNFSRWFKQVTGVTPFKYRRGEARQSTLQ